MYSLFIEIPSITRIIYFLLYAQTLQIIRAEDVTLRPSASLIHITPRQLTLSIACDPERPCITAHWLPPLLGPDTKLNSGVTTTEGFTEKLLAYRLRYLIVKPLGTTGEGELDVGTHRTESDTFLRMTEKNVTQLYMTTTAGEHLFGVQYEVRVAAVSDQGIGPDISERIAIPEAAPSDAPNNFHIAGGDETSIQLDWAPPHLQYRNGKITQYQVRCYVEGSEERTDELKSVLTTSIHLRDLVPATQSCFVRAWTSAGPGPWSNPVRFRIHPKDPTPIPPQAVRVSRIGADQVLIQWHSPDPVADEISHFILHYRPDDGLNGDQNLWERVVMDTFATSMKLNHLDPRMAYNFRVTSINRRGLESAPSEVAWLGVSDVRNPEMNRTVLKKPQGREPTHPDQLAVRNLKCSRELVDQIEIEWIPPKDTENLVEYQIQHTGRKEFLTESGILKAVHLGDDDIRQPSSMTGNRMNQWGVEADHRVTLERLHLSGLQPNSRYELTVRPIYGHVRSERRREGISVIVICHTEWSTPTQIPAPILETVHSAPAENKNLSPLIELRIHRVSEDYGPVHQYYVIVRPSEPGAMEARTAEEYRLTDLSDNARREKTVPKAAYLAIGLSPDTLFSQGKDSAIVLLGSDQHNQRRKRSPIKPSNESMQSGEIRDQRNVASAFSRISAPELFAVNKPISLDLIYEVAVRTCSQYSDGRRLCASSDWSEPINPRNPPTGQLDPMHLAQSNSRSNNDVGLTAWRTRNPVKFTIILASLAAGLVFFAVLSTILGCILRRRKQHFTERHMIGSAPQWDAQICEDMSKSMMAGDIRGLNSSMWSAKMQGHKCTTHGPDKTTGYWFGRSSSGMHSPSESSIGLAGLRTFQPSAGGLSTSAQPPLLSRITRSRSGRCSDGADMASDVPSPVCSHNNPSPTNHHHQHQHHHPQCRAHLQLQTHSNHGSCGNCSPLPNSPSRSLKNTAIALDRCAPTGVGSESPGERSKTIRGPMLQIEHSHSFSGRLPIPVAQFAQFVQKTCQEGGSLFIKEFQTIEHSPAYGYQSTHQAQMEIHKPLNRSPRAIPYDHNRVQIESRRDLLGSDYINASYIDGYGKPRAYIATQSPLPETMSDFWTMIWEHRVSVVVMLTQLVERGVMQADRYWPLNGSVSYGPLQVTQVDSIELTYHTTRTFIVQKIGSPEQRRVHHLQYTHWPDQPLPIHSTTYLMFLRRVGALTPQNSGPLVVHCSLGTGRTGVFIAMDILLDHVKHDQNLDLFAVVTRLRAERVNLIETDEEYRFLHETLREALVDGNTEVFARHLCTHLDQLCSTQRQSSSEATTNSPVKMLGAFGNDQSTQTGFQLEFAKINVNAPTILSSLMGITTLFSPNLSSRTKPSDRMLPADVAAMSVNREKNRDMSIIPFDWNRVHLCPIRGLDGSDYINASFVDGYGMRNAYIACQSPMASTVEDFWRMVWEQRTDILVMMCDLTEAGRESCFKYWPSVKPARYQFFVVDCTAEYRSTAGHTVRQFKITDARDGESRVVHQLQYNGWPAYGLPSTGDGLIGLVGQMHKLREQTGEDTGPVLVHCSTGADRSGVLIALCNVLERLRQESVVDMPQTIQLLRQQRVGLVQTEEQYRFCYTVALEYLSSFDLCTHPASQLSASQSPPRLYRKRTIDCTLRSPPKTVVTLT